MHFNVVLPIKCHISILEKLETNIACTISGQHISWDFILLIVDFQFLVITAYSASFGYRDQKWLSTSISTDVFALHLRGVRIRLEVVPYLRFSGSKEF